MASGARRAAARDPADGLQAVGREGLRRERDLLRREVDVMMKLENVDLTFILLKLFCNQGLMKTLPW